ncbi:MAG: imidazole glycerol phosphate synthase subunit HisH [Desulfarculaceae bacterium]|jgi:glutamine amidotransferase
MTDINQIKVAVVDYSLGNLFSVKQACARVGMEAEITSDPMKILAADAVFLPGVGAFGDAMHNLTRLGLVQPLKEVAEKGTPLIGICLGLQLLMNESCEFGQHRGLSLIPGEVVRFNSPKGARGSLKIPLVGWSRIQRPVSGTDHWKNTPLEDLSDGEYMYFVHSYYVKPSDSAVTLSLSSYGNITFCSGIHKNYIFGFQFHPEKSGPAGISIYHNLAKIIADVKRSKAAND